MERGLCLPCQEQRIGWTETSFKIVRVCLYITLWIYAYR